MKLTKGLRLHFEGTLNASYAAAATFISRQLEPETVFRLRSIRDMYAATSNAWSWTSRERGESKASPMSISTLLAWPTCAIGSVSSGMAEAELNEQLGLESDVRMAEKEEVDESLLLRLYDDPTVLPSSPSSPSAPSSSSPPTWWGSRSAKEGLRLKSESHGVESEESLVELKIKSKLSHSRDNSHEALGSATSWHASPALTLLLA
mmetsp:Transcript_29211/g.89475  ORF Transcript_29211/g.89475 Transcript_29211/m.89475 type:complete len:206 (-) Transcript_29211:1184-1801(-)